LRPNEMLMLRWCSHNENRCKRIGRKWRRVSLHAQPLANERSSAIRGRFQGVRARARQGLDTDYSTVHEHAPEETKSLSAERPVEKAGLLDCYRTLYWFKLG